MPSMKLLRWFNISFYTPWFFDTSVAQMAFAFGLSISTDTGTKYTSGILAETLVLASRVRMGGIR